MLAHLPDNPHAHHPGKGCGRIPAESDVKSTTRMDVERWNGFMAESPLGRCKAALCGPQELRVVAACPVS